LCSSCYLFFTFHISQCNSHTVSIHVPQLCPSSLKVNLQKSNDEQTWHPMKVILLWKSHFHAEQLNNVISRRRLNACQMNIVRRVATMFRPLSSAPYHSQSVTHWYWPFHNCTVSITTITVKLLSRYTITHHTNHSTQK